MTPSLTSPVKSGVRICAGPLSPHIASYRAKLEELGYTPSQVLYHLRAFAKFDLWLLRRKQRLWQLNETNVDEFLERLRTRLPAAFRGAPIALRLLLALLRNIGVVSPQREPIASTASARDSARIAAFEPP